MPGLPVTCGRRWQRLGRFAAGEIINTGARVMDGSHVSLPKSRFSQGRMSATRIRPASTPSMTTDHPDRA